MAHQDYTIAIIGPHDLVSGFRALGVEVFNADSSEEALKIITDLKKQTVSEDRAGAYGVVFVIDFLINGIPDDEYQKVTAGALPSIIAIPGLNGDKEAGTRKLRQLTEKAIGSDILSNE
ncbi:MAG: V-type ATP synthase subunit F [Candidatus Paceibacterota bacterium]